MTKKPTATVPLVLGKYFARIAISIVPFLLFFLLVASIAGVVGVGMGVPTLFRDGALRDETWWWVINSPAIWGHAGATLLLFSIWGGIDVYERLHRPDSEFEPVPARQRAASLALNAAPLLLLLLLAAAWPGVSHVAGTPPAAGAPEVQKPPNVLVELLESAAGIVVGSVAVGSLAWIAGVVRRVLGNPRLKRPVTWFVEFFRSVARPSGDAKLGAEVAGDFLSYLLSVSLVVLVGSLWQVIVPSFAVALLASFVVVGYFFFLYVRPSLRLAGSVVLGGAMWLSHVDPYFDRFPGLENRYRDPLCLTGVESGKAKGADLVDPVVALDAWLKTWREIHPVEKPKVAIVAVSGGAYRAGFWTAAVLDRLAGMKHEPGLEDLPGSIRLLTGASGGMVASAYFAALAQKEPSENGTWPSVTGRLHDDIKAYRNKKDSRHGKFPTRFPVDLDGLGPVAQEMVQRDVPRYLLAPLVAWNPLGDWTRWDDRGVVLEEQWLALGDTFSTLAQGERDGWRPSIIFSPMLVETGQPLLVSNLDLSPLVEGGEALELFSLFPEARSKLRLRTAVRMNATFPYISPAVSLPTVPPRRVVDAGYYDNYGVAVAASWLSMSSVRDWITANTRGVLVIQVRAQATDAVRDCHSEGHPSVAGQFLTSPLDAVMSARDSSMTFRNSQQLKTVEDLFPRKFVRTCTLEYGGRGEVSWYLTSQALKDMVRELGKNAPGLECVAREWKAEL